MKLFFFSFSLFQKIITFLIFIGNKRKVMILHLLFRFYLFIVLKIVKGVQFDIERLFGENDRGRNCRDDYQCF